MIWKKSSSYVKWILIISILGVRFASHFVFISSAQGGMALYDSVGLRPWSIGLTILQYAIAAYFIFQFYKRYKEISVLDSTKSLMGKIIKTRNTVKYYIICSLTLIFLSMALFALGIYITTDLNPLVEAFGYDRLGELEPQKLKKAIGRHIFGNGNFDAVDIWRYLLSPLRSSFTKTQKESWRTKKTGVLVLVFSKTPFLM